MQAQAASCQARGLVWDSRAWARHLGESRPLWRAGGHIHSVHVAGPSNVRWACLQPGPRQIWCGRVVVVMHWQASGTWTKAADERQGNASTVKVQRTIGDRGTQQSRRGAGYK